MSVSLLCYMLTLLSSSAALLLLCECVTQNLRNVQSSKLMNTFKTFLEGLLTLY